MPEDTQSNGLTPNAEQGATPTEKKTDAAQPGAEEISALPKWAQDIVHELREENAKRRKAADAAEAATRKQEEERLAAEKKWQELAELKGKEAETLKAKADAYEALQAQLVEKAKAESAKWPAEVVALLPDAAVDGSGYVAAVEKARALVEKMQEAPKGGNPANPAGAGAAQVVKESVRTENARFVGSRF